MKFLDILKRIEALLVTRPQPATVPPDPASVPAAPQPQAAEASPAPPMAVPSDRVDKTVAVPSALPIEETEPTEEATTSSAPRRAPSGRPCGRATRRARLYHLGVDWGTSSTKMVLRDYGSRDDTYDRGRAYVLRFKDRSYLYPSLVSYWRGTLWFGDLAQSRCRGVPCWASLKAGAAVRGCWHEGAQGLPGFTLEDLATLSVAHYTWLGFQEVRRHAESKRAEARMGMTLSVPVAELDVPETQRAYLRVAAIGYHLGAGLQVDPQGKRPEELLELLGQARESVVPRLEGTATSTYLRAEVAAAMMWPFRSPSVKEGPYTVVDIGAATTNASWFRIHAGRDEQGSHVPKASMTFFGAATQSPGMDSFDEVLAELLGQRDPTSLRGREADLVAGLPSVRGLEEVVGRYRETWTEAKRCAWRLAPREVHWEGTQILVVGGGAKVPLVNCAFDRPPSHTQARIVGARRLRDPGVPTDLFELPQVGGVERPFSDDETFVLVAYGLSFHDEDRPEINLPGDVEPFDGRCPGKDQPTSEDLGYDEK